MGRLARVPSRDGITSAVGSGQAVQCWAMKEGTGPCRHWAGGGFWQREHCIDVQRLGAGTGVGNSRERHWSRDM